MRDFQEFVFSNKVVVAGASWVFGMATKEFIQNLLEKILTPLFLFVSNQMLLTKYKKIILKNSGVFKFIGDVLYIFSLWIFTLLLAYFVLEIIFNRRIVGLKSSVTESDKISFTKSKLAAESSAFKSVEHKNDAIIEEELLLKYNSM